MKKYLLILTTIITLLSCNVDYETKKEDKSSTKDPVYTLVYVVFYPGYIDTIKVSGNENYEWYANSGYNRIHCNGTTIFESTAPFKIISYTKE